jgi:hypothetical protein
LPSAFDLLDAHFGQPDVSDFPFAERSSQEPELFVLGHGRIDSVKLIEIEAVESEPAQAAFERCPKALRATVDVPIVVVTAENSCQKRGTRDGEDGAEQSTSTSRCAMTSAP